MGMKLNEQLHEEEHPWKVYGSPSAKVLFVGTFPPAKKRWSYDFFYPNKANYFWNILAALQDKKLRHYAGEDAVAERKQLLDEVPAAVTDMGYKILRHGESSLDEHISPVQLMDIASILQEFQAIDRIILTSSSGKNSALAWFKSYFAAQGQTFTFSKSNTAANIIESVAGRSVDVVVVRSPSPRSARGLPFSELLQQYRSAITLS